MNEKYQISEFLDVNSETNQVCGHWNLPEPKAKILTALLELSNRSIQASILIDKYLLNISLECLFLMGIQAEIEYPKGEKKRIKAGGYFWYRTFCLLETMDEMNQLPWIGGYKQSASNLFMGMILEYEFLVPGMINSRHLSKKNKSAWYQKIRRKNHLLKSYEIAYEQEITSACLWAGNELAQKEHEFCLKCWLPMIEANSKYLCLQFNPRESKEPGKKPSSIEMIVDGSPVKPGKVKNKNNKKTRKKP